MDVTTRAQEAISAAQQRAVRDGNPQLEPAHVLLALLDQPDGIPSALLQSVGADRAALRAAAETAVSQLPRASGSTVAAPQASGALQRVLATAQQVAAERGDSYLSTEHLLLALASSGGESAALLAGAGANEATLTDALDLLRGSQHVTSADPEGTFQALEKYGVDLTARAREGKVDPVIGRDA